jgi:hypothetical protein
MPEEIENPLAKITSVDCFTGAGGVMSVTDRGMVIRGAFTYGEWRAALYGMVKLREVFHSAVADVVAYGRSEFGDVLVEEACGQMQLPLNDIKRSDAIAKIPWGARDEALTQEHLYVAGAAPDLRPEERRVWLETAVAEKLSPVELKRSIEIGKVQHAERTPAGRGAGSGIVNIQAIRAFFLQWKRANFEVIRAGPLDTQQRLLEALRPFAEVIDILRANLAQPS